MKRAAFIALPSPVTLSLFRSPSPATNLLRPRPLSNHHTPITIRWTLNRDPMSSSEAKSEKTEEGEKESPPEAAPAPPKKKEAPPPPEQPDPGDCCGSGCVRCVWDVYYDELDEYNKLLEEINSSPAG